MNSPNHLESAGAASKGVEPMLNTYLGPLSAHAEKKHAARAAAVGAAVRAAAAADVRPSACATALSCIRDLSAQRGELDKFGLCAVTCALLSF
jgi:hypothetical protein